MSHPPRIPVWLDWEKPVVYLITICAADRKAVLANDTTFKALKKAAAKLTEWKVLAAIIMPDPIHVIVTPIRDREAKVGNFSGALKRWIRDYLSASWKFQPGCFDRLLRSDESLHEKWRYLQENPMRAGLVNNSSDWPYQIGLNEDDF